MADPDMIDVTEFTCPRCGSHKFGTVLEGDPLDARTMVGHCYGEATVRSHVGIQLVRCGFTWWRSDDAKYFCKTGRQIAAMHVGTVST